MVLQPSSAAIEQLHYMLFLMTSQASCFDCSNVMGKLHCSFRMHNHQKPCIRYKGTQMQIYTAFAQQPATLLLCRPQELNDQQQQAVGLLAEYQAEYASELDTIKLQHQKAATQMQSQHQTEVQELSTQHQQAETQLQQEQLEHKRALADAKKQTEAHLQQHEKAVADMQEQVEIQLEHQQCKHEQLLAEAQGGYQQQLAELLAERAESEAEAQLRHDEELQRISEAHRTALAELEGARSVKVSVGWSCEICCE